MRGGYRANAGRPGWRRKIERTLSLDIRELARLGCLRPGDGPFGWHWIFLQTRTESVELGVQPHAERLELEYRTGGEWRHASILLDRIRCHFGGSRPLFRCPYCEHRRALLYLPAKKANFGCRVCWKLAHAVEAEDATGRVWRKQHKLAARLEAEDRTDRHPPRPKGMHQRTYQRVLERIWACEMWQDQQLYLRMPGLWK